MRTFLIITILSISFLRVCAQQLNVDETINYITTNVKKYRVGGDDSLSIKITENGFVILTQFAKCQGGAICHSEIKFQYKSVNFKASEQTVWLMCSSPNYNNPQGCIQTIAGLNSFADLLISFDLEGVEKIKNAFQYLMEIIPFDDRYNNNDNDPFSSANYQKTNFESVDTSANNQTIKLIKDGNLFSVDAKVCGILKQLILDSGASDVIISSDTEHELIEKKLISEKDFLTSSLYRLADGRIVQARRLIIPSIKIGSFTVENVICSVNPSSDIQLLGKSILNRFSKWTIDNNANTLMLEK